MSDRHASAAGGLARGGFVEPEKARALLDSLRTLPPFDDDEVLAGVADQLGAAADPDLALRQFPWWVHQRRWVISWCAITRAWTCSRMQTS